MTALFKMKCCNTRSSASVVDGKLVLSFPGAMTPVVWQMDFSQVKASALEVRENATAGSYMLVLKTPKGETVDVAPFQTRQEAVAGLMAAARALEGAHGRINTSPVANDVASYARMPRQGSRKGWLWVVGVLAILIVLMALWGAMAPRPPASMRSASAPEAPGAAAPMEEAPAGVPLSADDFLRNNQQ